MCTHAAHRHRQSRRIQGKLKFIGKIHGLPQIYGLPQINGLPQRHGLPKSHQDNRTKIQRHWHEDRKDQSGHRRFLHHSPRTQIATRFHYNGDRRRRKLTHHPHRSSRCKRETRSVISAEIHALILGFDQAYDIRDLLTELIGKEVEIVSYVDRKTLFYKVAKDCTTAERRLLIDIFKIKESYTRGVLKRISYFPGETPADALTRHILTQQYPSWIFMTTNRFKSTPVGWESTSTNRERGKDAEGETKHAKTWGRSNVDVYVY